MLSCSEIPPEVTATCHLSHYPNFKQCSVLSYLFLSPYSFILLFQSRLWSQAFQMTERAQYVHDSISDFSWCCKQEQVSSFLKDFLLSHYKFEHITGRETVCFSALTLCIFSYPGKRLNSSFEGWVKTSVIISSTPGLA